MQAAISRSIASVTRRCASGLVIAGLLLAGITSGSSAQTLQKEGLAGIKLGDKLSDVKSRFPQSALNDFRESKKKGIFQWDYRLSGDYRLAGPGQSESETIRFLADGDDVIMSVMAQFPADTKFNTESLAETMSSLVGKQPIRELGPDASRASACSSVTGGPRVNDNLAPFLRQRSFTFDVNEMTVEIDNKWTICCMAHTERAKPCHDWESKYGSPPMSITWKRK